MTNHARTGTDAETLFRHLLTLSDRIHHALDTHDAEGVLMAIKERDSIILRIEPLLRELLDARANLAGGSSSPTEAVAIADILDGISRLAQRVQTTDARIAGRLAAERERIADEIEHLERAGAIADAYQREAQRCVNRIDRVG